MGMRATFCGRPVAADRALIMAIVNRTPDSFYDRGATFTDEAAKQALPPVASFRCVIFNLAHCSAP